MVNKCTVNRICIVFLAFVFLMLSPQETESQQANIMVEPIAQYPENSHVFLKAIPTLHFPRGDEVIETKFDLPEGTYQSQWTYILTGRLRDTSQFTHNGGKVIIKPYSQ